MPQILGGGVVTACLPGIKNAINKLIEIEILFYICDIKTEKRKLNNYIFNMITNIH